MEDCLHSHDEKCQGEVELVPSVAVGSDAMLPLCEFHTNDYFDRMQKISSDYQINLNW